jgi:hypothetical protein
MRILKSALIAAVSIGVSGCVTNPEAETFCGRQVVTCVGVGALALLGVLVLAAAAQSDGDFYSDIRLKRNVRPAGTLPNGVNLYAFRYWNDDRVFVGVMAQDLLTDPRFSHAVSIGEGGYYVVDLRALGLAIIGDRAQFLEAGENAARVATAN